MDQELLEYLQGEFGKIDKRLDATDRRIDEVRDDLRGEIRREIRQTHVLIEQARDEIRTVAEGVVTNGERIDRLREESRRERHEIRDELLGHLRSSHQSLDRRVSRLEEIVSDSPRRMPRL